MPDRDEVKAQVRDKLGDALAEAENDDFDAAAMWADLAAEQWADYAEKGANHGDR